MPTITALTPSKRNATKLIIFAGGKTVGTLPAKEIEKLGLAVGDEWSEAIASRVAELIALDRAFEQAMQLVNRRPLARSALKKKLAEAGHAEDVVSRVVERMVKVGAISDEALAQSLMDEMDRRKPAGPALKRAKLAQRGVTEDVIDRVIAASDSPAAQREAAKRLVTSKAKAMARLDETTRKRRLYGLLARRGFDEDVIEAVLGTMDVE